MSYRDMAQISTLLSKADMLLVLHLLSHRDFTLAEIGRATGRSQRQVESFIAGLEAIGVVVSRTWRGDRFYNLASTEIRNMITVLVGLDVATGRQRRHLRLVYAADVGDVATAPPAVQTPEPTRPGAILRAVPAAS